MIEPYDPVGDTSPKTPQQFKEQAQNLKILDWGLHNCSICDYPCGFLFNDNMEVYYDKGCNCTIGGPNIFPRTWEDVAQHYNMQTAPIVINKMNEYWGFK